MIHKVDWISFSIPMEPKDMQNELEAPAQVVAALEHLHENLPEWLSLGDEYEVRNGRAPYKTGWSRADAGMVVFTHCELPHALIEVSGKGCDRLQTEGHLYDVLQAVSERVTRLDIACDILTDTRPIEFEKDRESGRFSARSEMVSESGETVYVGSRTSERYARVYRYNSPHPRHHLLRVEYVIKASSAKAMARTLSLETLPALVASLGSAFGWNHPDWSPTAAPIELEVYRPERKTGKTLWWLNDTIAPLLVRLHTEGDLDIWEWLNTQVVPKLQAKETLKY